MVKEFSTRVAGIYYSRGHVSGIQNGDVFRLIREPHNPHDANAIRVELADGSLLGRIPRIVAASLARDMDSGLKAYAVVQWTSPGHSGSPPRYGRGRRGRRPAVQPSPPECQITVRIGDGELIVPPPTPPRAAYTPPRTTPPPSSTPTPQAATSKSSCFVATAVFCDAEHPTVAALRRWRDSSLARHRFGRLFIRGYLASGPYLAHIVNAVPALRRLLAPILTVTARFVASEPPLPKTES